jgi:outer membrane murein-binding lipoprotein Lpp
MGEITKSVSGTKRAFWERLCADRTPQEYSNEPRLRADDVEETKTERSIKMNIETKVTKKAVQDMLEAKIKTLESKFETLKAQAEAAKATAEIKAIAAITVQKIQLRQKFEELRSVGEGNWEHAKKNLESLVATFEKEVKDIEAKVRAR